MMNYTHNVCVHKHHLVDLVTGVHSNWIENFSGNLKIKLKSIRGSQKKMLDSQIDEYLYRYNRVNEGTIFDLLMADLEHFYPV